VLILLTVPLLVAAIFTLPLVSIPRLPGWMILASSFLMMFVAIISVKYVIRKWGAVNAEVAMDDKNITIRLLQRSPFYSRREYASTWEDLENVSSNIDPRHGVRFYMISFRNPSVTVTLTPTEEIDVEAETAFGDVLLEYVSHFNAENQTQQKASIHRRGFYEAWWAKAITLCVYLIIPLAMIVHFTIPEKVSTWRLVQVFCIGFGWLIVYHTNQRKKPS
jgi:hypothetical protein